MMATAEFVVPAQKAVLVMTLRESRCVIGSHTKINADDGTLNLFC
jgi:hypothetical protein